MRTNTHTHTHTQIDGQQIAGSSTDEESQKALKEIHKEGLGNATVRAHCTPPA